MAETAKSLLKSGCTAIVAGGGDGSLGPIAALAAASKVPFAALPFGTLNHFAKDLGIPTDHAALVDMLQDEHTKKIDYATVNDHTFLNNSSLGLYPKLVFRREEREERMCKWPAAFISMLGLMRKPLSTYRLDLTVESVQGSVKTPFVFIGNNDYGFDKFGINRRESLEAGKLNLCIYHGSSRGELLWQFIRAVFGKPSPDTMNSTFATEVTIQSTQSTLGISLDGEAFKESMPLRYRIHPKALTVIIPK